MNENNNPVSEFEAGWNDFHNGVEKSKVVGEERIKGYELAEAGGLIKATDFYNDR